MSDKQIRNNQRYNAERKAQAELMKRDLDRDKMLAQIYQESFDRMQKEIDGFYMRYASKEGLTNQEAMKRVSEMDVTKFNAKAAKAVKEKDFSHATNEWLKVYNLKMKVSRLELLKAELTLEIQNLTAEVNEVFDKARTDEYLAEYKRQAGILGISSSGAKKRMQAILDADFYGQNFSARVWGGLGLRATLQREVFGSLNRIFTDMMGYKQEMKRLAKKYGTSEQNAKRLLKTEIARINADTQLAMLKENGFTHLIYVAEPGACEVCQTLDGKAIPIEDVEKGVNLYPMHPNCRCSSYGHIKMDYKAGGSTLDREAPNGVWGEDKKANAEKESQKQIAGNAQKLLERPADKVYNKPKKTASELLKEQLQKSKAQSGQQPVAKPSKPVVPPKTAERYAVVTPEIEKALQKQSDKLYKNMFLEERYAFDGYTNADYRTINEYLRGINKDGVTWPEDSVKLIDKVLSNNRIDKDLVLYRGVSPEEFELWKKGEKWDTYLSTSIDPEVVSTVFEEDEYGNKRRLVEIHASRTTKGIYIGENTAVMNEKEMLLHRGQKYKILEENENRIKVEVVSE